MWWHLVSHLEHTQRNLSEILINRTEIRLYLTLTDWLETKLSGAITPWKNSRWDRDPFAPYLEFAPVTPFGIFPSIKRATVREAAVSRYHGGLIKCPPETPRGHLGAMVSRGLRQPLNWASITLRSVSLSDGRPKKSSKSHLNVQFMEKIIPIKLNCLNLVYLFF